MEMLSEGQLKKLMDRRQRRDMKMLIRLVMETPLNDGEVFEVDGKTSIKELSKKNLDVQTRIWLTMAGQAAGGDVKAAELMLKYGGYTPPVEQNVNVNLPRIVNDLEFKEEQQIETIEAGYELIEPLKEEKKDVKSIDSEVI